MRPQPPSSVTSSFPGSGLAPEPLTTHPFPITGFTTALPRGLSDPGQVTEPL